MAAIFSVTSPQQILTSPLNDSKSKYHWSFGKAQRFKKNQSKYTSIPISFIINFFLSPQFSCPISFYEVPNTKSRRASSFGYGKRSSFLLTTDSPSPYLYNTSHLFKKADRNSRGTKFGKGRDQCKDNSYIDPQKLKNPGPGDYNSMRDTSVSFSMRPKTAYPKDYFIADVEKTITPGPGTYQSLQTLDKGGHNIQSRVPNPMRTSLDTKSKRFSLSSITPGPGHYDDRNVMNKTGEYLLSINRSDGKRAFGMERRELKLDGNRLTPGPGTYRKPSDFGHYEKETLINTLEISGSRTSRRPLTARR